MKPIWRKSLRVALAGLLTWFAVGCVSGAVLRPEGAGSPLVWDLPGMPDFQVGAWIGPDGQPRPGIPSFTMPGEVPDPTPGVVWSVVADKAMATYLEEIYARFEANKAALLALGGALRPDPKAEGAEAHEVLSEAVVTAGEATKGATPSPPEATWPSVWSPTGHKEIGRQSRIATLNGEMYIVDFVRYDDGTLVHFVHTRPYAVDTAPKEPCAPYWRDHGMLSPDGQRVIPASEWQSPDWRLKASEAPGCPQAGGA